MGKKSYIFIISLNIILLFLCLPAWAEVSSETRDEYSFKIDVERHLEERLRTVIKDMTSIEDVIIIVNAEIMSEARKNEEKEEEKQDEDIAMELKRPMILPGVPVRNEFFLPLARNNSGGMLYVNSLDITVLVDNVIPDHLIKTIHDVAISLVGYNPDRGDQLEIRKVSFSKQSFDWQSQFLPPNIYFMILAILGGLFLVASALFFMDPFKKLSVAVKDINWNIIRGDEEGGSSRMDMPAAGMQSITALAADTPAPTSNGNGKKKLFGFIHPGNISQLSYLLKDAPVADIATVVNYLSPELSSRLLETYTIEKQAETVIQLQTSQESDASYVGQLEDKLKERLDFVVGGEDRLASILNLADEEVRERVLESIEQSDFEAATRMKGKVKNFDSVIHTMEPAALQSLIRRVAPNVFAQVLKNAPGDVQQKVFSALSGGASERIMEEMRYSKTLSAARMKKEKQRIIAMYREMVDAGLIDEDAYHESENQ
jgi:hypothetical protein